MNHYPRHVGDITRDTFGLSLTEFGAYDRLLDAYYSSEKPIPHAERYRLTGAVSKADKAAVDYVMGRYFTEQADGWHQKRADVEIATFRDKSAKASASANAMWNKRNADAMRTHSDGNASQKPVTSNHKPVDQEQSGGAVAPAPAKRSRPMQLPKGWEIPAAWGDWAQQERPDWSSADVLRVSLLFRDHWQGKGEARADWEATWRNWVRRERAQFSGGGGAKQSARAAVIGEIFKGVRDERSDERTIDGQAERVA